MTNRENALAVLRYQKFDHFPVVAFGYWKDTVMKWANEGHITKEEYVSPHYKKITSLLNANGIDIVSVDCDGLVDYLLPI